MSVDAIIQELPKLTMRICCAFKTPLNSIRDQRNPEYMEELERRLDDKDPSHWITLEEFDRRMSLGKCDTGE